MNFPSTSNGTGLMKWTFSKLNLGSSANDSSDISQDSISSAFSSPDVTATPPSPSPPSSHARTTDSSPSLIAACGAGHVASTGSSRRLLHPSSSSSYRLLNPRTLPYHDPSLVHPHSPARRRRETTRARIEDLRDSASDELQKLRTEINLLKTENRNLEMNMMQVRSLCEEKDDKILKQDIQLKNLKEYFECSVCAAYFDQPYFLSCGHTFCQHCLQSWFACIKQSQPSSALLHVNSCPMCRAAIRVPAPAYLIRTMVEKFVPASQRIRSRARPATSAVQWEGIFEEELEVCDGCGGLARLGECLGYAGVFGQDTIVGFPSALEYAQAAARGNVNGIPHITLV